MTVSWEIRQGDALERLREMPAGSVQMCVTSPPYFGLRDYGAEGQVGLEATPDEYVARLVEVFREVRRVLRDDGTLWLNLGDSYASTSSGGDTKSGFNDRYFGTEHGGGKQADIGGNYASVKRLLPSDCKPKDLLGLPWMVAFALRADGWYLRSDIVWAKPNPMPESVTDRPTKAHEYLFLLAKSPRYFWDADAVREKHETSLPVVDKSSRTRGVETLDRSDAQNGADEWGSVGYHPAGRNKRSVWAVATQPFPGAHFAVFPPKLIEPCILAGSSPQACGVCGGPWVRVVETTADGSGHESPKDRDQFETHAVVHGHTEAVFESSRLHGQYHNVQRTTLGWKPSCSCRCPNCDGQGTHTDGVDTVECVACEGEGTDATGSSVVLDPFAGAGTTGLVAIRHNRSFIGIELNPEYAEMARHRIRDDQPLMNYLTEVAA